MYFNLLWAHGNDFINTHMIYLIQANRVFNQIEYSVSNFLKLKGIGNQIKNLNIKVGNIIFIGPVSLQLFIASCTYFLINV